MSKRYKIGLLVLLILVILVIFSNIILSNLISKVVNNQLDKINNKGEVSLKIDKIGIDIFTGNLNMKNVSIKPDSLFFENFKLGKTPNAVVADFHLSELKIKGFNIFKILWFKKILVKQILVRGIDLNLYKSDLFIADIAAVKKTEKQSFDSIYIKGVEQIDLSRIEFDDFNIKIFHAQKQDTLFSYSGRAFEISGIALRNYENAKSYFKFDKEFLIVNFKNQQVDIEKGNYMLSVEDILFDHSKKNIKISSFKMKPRMDRAKLASTYKYNSEVFDVETKEMSIDGFYLDTIVRTGVIALDSIVVDGLNLDIYKDQTKPFNLEKRPLFLNQKLKKLDHPIYINKVLIKNTFFSYREKYENKDNLMAIDISAMNAELSYLTSIKDSLETDKKITINIKGKLNSVADLNLDILMPYNTWNDSFSFTGSVGASQLSAFNSAIFPAAGIRLESGMLKSMQFSVTGNPTDGTQGSMIMRYSNINADLIIEEKEKKGLTWIANSVMVKSNPSDKGKLKVALIEAERVPYKGFSNLLWKSVMSGMVNTINPVGKTVKREKKHNRNKEKKDWKKWFAKS